MIEIYKFLNDLSPPIMNDIFRKQENYYLPQDIENSHSLNLFKSNIKNVEP